MLKVALTHDIDRVRKTYQYITYSIKSLLNGDSRKFLYHIKSFFGPNPYWCFQDIITIENDYNVKSSIFFLDESIKLDLFNIKNWKLSMGRYDLFDNEVIKMMQYLDNNGWEIGLHGSYNSYNDQFYSRYCPY